MVSLVGSQSLYLSHPSSLRSKQALTVSAQQGAATGVHLCTSQDALRDKGMYWERMSLRGPNPLVHDVQTRQAVWEKMAEECRLPEELRL